MSKLEAASGIEQDVYNALTKLSLLLDDCDQHFVAEHGLSVRQFWALQHLDENQGRSMVDLSRLLLTDKSNVTSIVDHLERACMAQRTPASHDRRVILITLTPEGRHLRDSLNAQHQARIRELLGSVDDDHLHTLLDHLRPVVHNLEAYLARASNNSKVSSG